MSVSVTHDGVYFVLTCTAKDSGIPREGWERLSRSRWTTDDPLRASPYADDMDADAAEVLERFWSDLEQRFEAEVSVRLDGIPEHDSDGFPNPRWQATRSAIWRTMTTPRKRTVEYPDESPMRDSLATTEQHPDRKTEAARTQARLAAASRNRSRQHDAEVALRDGVQITVDGHGLHLCAFAAVRGKCRPGPVTAHGTAMSDAHGQVAIRFLFPATDMSAIAAALMTGPATIGIHLDDTTVGGLQGTWLRKPSTDSTMKPRTVTTQRRRAF